MKGLDRLFTVSKHVDPTAVANATSPIDPFIDELTQGIAGLMSIYASKIGAMGTTLAPIAIVGLQLGAAAARHAVDGHIEAGQPAA